MNLSKSIALFCLFLLLISVPLGCLDSRTVVITQTYYERHFWPTNPQQPEFYALVVYVDMNEKWKKYNQEIIEMKLFGMEIWITNHTSTATSLSIYLDEEGILSQVNALDAYAELIYADIPIAAGPGIQTHLSYNESFHYLVSMDAIRPFDKFGNYISYWIDSTHDSNNFTVDSVRLIMTYRTKS